MSRTATDLHDDQNYDSFLDIVANLVGILVILIMVIGVRARHAWNEAAPEDIVEQVESVAPPETIQTPAAEVNLPELVVVQPEPQPEDPAPEPTMSQEEYDEQFSERNAKVGELVDAGQRAASAQKSIHKDIFDIDANIKEIERLAEIEAKERSDLQMMISMAKAAINERRSKLETNQQIELALARQVGEAKVALASLQQQKSAVESSIGRPNILEHRPTPLARTVFGQEEHFRLLGGFLSHVPINELEYSFKRDAPRKVWKFNSNEEVTETIGPIAGYRMKYTIIRTREQVRTPEGNTRVIPIVALKEFVMVPESPRLGAPTETQLQPGSEFAERIAGLRPDETAITVWTYPDSFAEFRAVKSYLAARGFSVAARLLPHDFPIRAAPHGTRAAAQ